MLLLQHLSSLLAASDKEVVKATLQTLVAFLRKTHGSSVRWHGSSDLNTRLLALSQGWGVKELVGSGLLTSITLAAELVACGAAADIMQLSYFKMMLCACRALIWQSAQTAMRALYRM